MKILYLTTVIPTSRKTGGEIASQNFIDALKRNGHDVVVIAYQRLGDIQQESKNEIIVGKRHIESNKSRLYPLLWMGDSLLRKYPYSAAKYYSLNYVKSVKNILSNDTYDAVIVDHAQICWIADLLSKKIKKIIFIAHNIEHEVYLTQCQNTHNPLTKYIYQREATLIQTCEDYLASLAIQVWTLTPHDSKYFWKLNPNTQAFDLPSSLNIRFNSWQHPVSSKKFDIGIIGSWTWNANMLGLKWFFQQVYPHLPKNLSIHVAGKGAEWLSGEYDNVHYCGFVPDVQEFMSQAKAIAIPSVAGGGIQIKTLDAIASGLPIVATPTALRGIFEYPAGIEVAEQADKFADILTDLVTKTDFTENSRISLLEERKQWLQLRQQQFTTKVNNAINSLGY
ncbi:glycosyltransferase family 4 protein [Calothrix sp. UHCC 0171]|uniref:glycosyltransferase family 4 protein n=1 Tax=Calothrix sp. UHCC 0171 TaxID=3110245 RepID=UPI002B21C070|nr:glycosyltransferase family 4 protein [Calothrix sp. UHCC 0171]MEA5570618.1 glycosyltransferase family 4 protein [Calothrix sp. UHCC 0171]